MPKSYWFGKGIDRNMVSTPAWMTAALDQIRLTTPGLLSVPHVILEIVAEQLIKLGYAPPSQEGHRPLQSLISGVPQKEKPSSRRPAGTRGQAS